MCNNMKIGIGIRLGKWAKYSVTTPPQCPFFCRFSWCKTFDTWPPRWQWKTPQKIQVRTLAKGFPKVSTVTYNMSTKMWWDQMQVIGQQEHVASHQVRCRYNLPSGSGSCTIGRVSCSKGMQRVLAPPPSPSHFVRAFTFSSTACTIFTKTSFTQQDDKLNARIKLRFWYQSPQAQSQRFLTLWNENQMSLLHFLLLDC